MFSRIVLCVAVAGLLLPTMAVQADETPTPALYKSYPEDAAVNAQLLFLDRVSFVKNMYELTPEEMEGVLAVLKTAVPRQEQYEKARRVSLLRIRLAMTQAASLADRSEAFKQKLIRRFQNQINKIHANAPLSLANVMTLAERLVPAEKITAGNQRIVDLLVERTGKKAEDIDVKQIDALLAELVVPGEKLELPYSPSSPDKGSRLHARPYGPTPEERAEQRAQELRGKQPQKSPKKKAAEKPAELLAKELAPPDAEAEARAMLERRAKKEAAATKRGPKKHETTRIIEPAPPMVEWSDYCDQAVVKYGFTGEQKLAAKSIMSSVMDRAAKQQQVVETAEDTDVKKNAQKKLDRLYDELVQRLNSIATIEQRIKAEDNEAAKSASASVEKKTAE